MSELVTIVNRSSKTLKGVWDGRHYDLEPNKKYQFPTIVARKFQEQNPLMGSMNPYSMQTTYLIAIEEEGDDCSPLEQSTAIEKLDRKLLGNEDQVTVIKGHGLYSKQGDGAVPAPNAINTDFTAR